MTTALVCNNPASGKRGTRGTNTDNQAASASWWVAAPADAAYVLNVASLSRSTVAGPTSGVEALSGGISLEWLSPPVAAGVTISGTISFAAQAYESSMSANAAVGCRIDKVSATDFSLTTIYNGKDNAELGTSPAQMTWTGTPTSTALAKGDRLRVVWYFDDATANMASGYTVYILVGGSSNLTQITFNETFSFQTSDPSTQQIFPTSTASDLATADVDYKAWTSRGT